MLLIQGMAMLEIFELVQGLLAVEDPDVLRLSRSKSTHRPAQMNEVWLDGRVHRVHADLAGQIVCFPCVARAASGDDVGPVVGSAT